MSAEAKICAGFHWVGQDFAHCDNCGRDLREHDGLNALRPGASAFDLSADATMVLPFKEAMERMPLFAHYVTPRNASRPYRWEYSESPSVERADQ